ncbi:hypothetical protein [Devriesea agamarum]|uniref:hypothetical protein n=1 Tax=Devriesea agamarum TaxID=472569 RepID=UPI00071E12CD|nr:hypothetical protein [Devriesea agamarum]
MRSPNHQAAIPGTGATALMSEDGKGVVRTASGQFLRLQTPPADLIATLTNPTDHTATEPEADEPTRAHATRLQHEIAAREIREADNRWPQTRRNVAITGTGDIPEKLAAALLDWGITAHCIPTASDLDLTDTHWDLVIGYATGPSEREAWSRLDQLPRNGTAWLRAYREGHVCYVDPIAITEHDPTSTQVTKRRLAASPVPAELAAWQRTAPDEPNPLPLTAHTWLLGHILTVALSWAQNAPDCERYRYTLWKHVPAAGTTDEHTIIAYPAPFQPSPQGATG